MYEDDINGSGEPEESGTESPASGEGDAPVAPQQPASLSGSTEPGGSQSSGLDDHQMAASECPAQHGSDAGQDSATEPLRVPGSPDAGAGASGTAAGQTGQGSGQYQGSWERQPSAGPQEQRFDRTGETDWQSTEAGQHASASAYSTSAASGPQQGQPSSYSTSGHGAASHAQPSQQGHPASGGVGYPGGQQPQQRSAYSTSAASGPQQGQPSYSASGYSPSRSQPSAGGAGYTGGQQPQQGAQGPSYEPAPQERPAYYTDNVYSGTSRPNYAGNASQPSSHPAGSYGYADHPGQQTGQGQPQPGQAQTGQAAPTYATPAYTAEQQVEQDASKGKKKAKRQRKPKKEKKESSGVKSFVWGIVGIVAGAAIVLGALGLSGNLGSSSSDDDSSTTEVSTNSDGTITINASSEDASIAQAVAAKVLPSVVSIDVYEESASYSFGNMMGSTDSTETEETQTATGSGVIISEDGYIVTNYHVVAEGTIYIVYFDDDTSAEATIVGYDDSSDLAVLKVEKDGLTAIDVGDSSEVAVGDWVMTAGSPFGLTKSVSSGIVSALYRNETLENSYGSSFYVNMIQVDAGVNPGNSGGALVNDEGELIGICTLTASYSGDFSGVGFAIPSNYVMNIAESIIENGYAEHPYIGVSVGTVDASTQQYYGTTAEYGAYVASVVSGGPAEEAGIQEGDVIVSMDGEAITTSSELIIDVRSKEIGDTVELGVIRDGEELTIEVTLASDSESVDSES